MNASHVGNQTRYLQNNIQQAQIVWLIHVRFNNRINSITIYTFVVYVTTICQ
jgi:hypothetical protein